MAREQSRGKDMGRTLRMLRALMEGQVLDANTASQTLGIKPEGALRNLKLLATIIPGVSQASQGAKYIFRFDPGTAFGSEPLKETRPRVATAIAVTLGAAFSRVFGRTEYQTALEELRQRVIEQLAGTWRQHFAALGRKFVVICGAEEVLGDRSEILDAVIEAVLKQKLVSFEYRKFEGDTKRLIARPYSLAVYDAHLYLVASPQKEGTYQRPHTYRFGRILDLDVLPETFNYPEVNEYDPDVLFGDSIGIWASAPEPTRIVIRLSNFWAIFAKHHRWHRSQQIVEELEGGEVLLEFRVRPCPEFEQWVLRFGEHAEVREPRELRERVALRLANACKRYRLGDASEGAK